MNKTKISCAIVTALALNPAIAQEKTAKAQIETIQITATKRTESIQDVPVSVSALNGEALEVLGIESFSDYVEFLPNVIFQGTGPGQNEIYIRGAATSQTNIAVSSVQALQPSVAFYLDEQPVSMQGRNLDVYVTIAIRRPASITYMSTFSFSHAGTHVFAVGACIQQAACVYMC